MLYKVILPQELFMKVVSFNVNGIRARLHQLNAIKERLNADIIGLQEVKATEEQYPFEDIDPLGYESQVHAQKAHYGVATLSKVKSSHVNKGFPNDTENSQKRFIHTQYLLPNDETLHVLNGYFPQGENRSHETKFPTKQAFYQDLLVYLNEKFSPNDHVLVMGDFNVAPKDQDIGIGEQNAKRWLKAGRCAFLPEEREWLQAVENWGLVDSYRALNPNIDDRFSWFDYRSKGFNDDPKRGLRIDLILITQPLVERLIDSGIDYETRSMEKPSDHAPIFALFDF